MRSMRTKGGRRESSVARQILLLQVLVVVVLVVAALALAAYDARQRRADTAAEQAVAVAESVADSPTVVTALKRPRPAPPCCSRTPRRSGATPAVDFVVVMDLDRTRYTPPRPRPDRQAVRRRPRRRARGRRVHPGVRRARSARRCAPSSR